MAAKYNGRVNISDLRKFEKLSIKTRKSELDLAFLRNCKSLKVFPKFLCFHLPANMDRTRQDALGIRRKLLKSAVNRCTKEHHRLLLERDRLKNRISETLSSIDRYILHKSVDHNVTKGVKEFIKTHEKKLKNLTKNSVLPFTSDEVVTNLSSVALNADQLNVLKYGLTHSICPPSINKRDIFACFELISQRMLKNLKESKDTGKLATELSHLADTYVSSYRPTATDLKKHRILKELRKNKNIVILRLDMGNGAVILDRVEYDKGLFKIINDTTKFRVLTSDPTLTREGKLQRYLRELRKKGHFHPDVYETIYPSGSQPARIYGLPKMHKPRASNSTPPFRPIVSSIGT